jgi:glycosyltransferase involved in cell wall biosynthesis
MPSRALSVIIPAYNAQDYIADCLLSILRQPESGKINIIVVIDGATDETLSEVSKVSTGSDNIIVLIQENLGLSAARNNGLAHVVTDHVTFLDADDIWLPNYLETLLPLLVEEPDLIEYDAIKINESANPLKILKIASAKSGTITLSSPHDFVSMFQCYAWARIYRTHLIRAHPFPVSRRFEDTATTPWLHWHSKKTFSVGEALIGYRQHSKSILKNPLRTDINDIATTAAEAATMYKNTCSGYWRQVAHRCFQQGCSQILFQPRELWPEYVQRIQSAIVGVPPPNGIMRYLQARATMLYLALLYSKRRFVNLFSVSE